MRSICVFCGSSPGADPRFMASATALGQALAESDRVLVYGGAKVGLMGALAVAHSRHRRFPQPGVWGRVSPVPYLV